LIARDFASGFLTTGQISLTQPHANIAAIWQAGIIPTIAALLVTALQIIERAQVDWTADCGAPGVCETVQQGELFAGMLGWLPALFVFAVLHAALRRYPSQIEASRPDRLVRVVVFMAASIYPHMGWYLALAGIAAGFLAAITVIGLVVAPVVGIIGATWFGGLVLGVAAGPSFSAGWAVWKRVLLRYANASALAGTVLAGGYGLFDPQFSLIAGAYPWFDALGLLLATAAACCIIWIMTFDAGEIVRSRIRRPVLTGVIAGLVVASLVMTMPAVLSVEAGLKPMNLAGNWGASVTAYVRGYKPPQTRTLQLAGLDYVGARNLVSLQSSERRDRMVTQSLNVGTPQQINVGRSETYRVVSWRMVPPLQGQEQIHIVADDGGEMRELHCLAPTAGERTCLRDRHVADHLSPELVRSAMTFQSEDAFEFSDDLPNTYFGINFSKALKLNGVRLIDGPRQYCRLGLVNVTSVRLSVHQIVPCDQPWKEQAIRLRAYVERLFRPPTPS
jgi:hypothetical protein